jgi:HAD superfamily hydrolase (TIGR01459 family)
MINHIKFHYLLTCATYCISMTKNTPPLDLKKYLGFEIEGLSLVADHYDAFIIDLWGVIYDGQRVFDDAKNVLKELMSQGKIVHLITNNPRSAAENIQRLQELGLSSDHYSDIITAGQKTIDLLKSGILLPDHKRPLNTYLIDDINLCDWLDTANLRVVPDIHTADIILSIHMDETLHTPTPFVPLFETAIELGIPHVCSNPDKYVMKNNVKMARIGVLADLYKALGGTVYEIGKPHPIMFENILNTHNPKKILLIGDSLVTDITAANHINVDSLLVTSGYHQEEFSSASRLSNKNLFKNYGISPTYVCESLLW